MRNRRQRGPGELAREAGGILFRVKKTREQEILELAAEGLTDKLIAGRLNIQVGTVGTYWRRIRKKLAASNRSEAVAKSLKQSSDALAAVLGALHDLVFVHDEHGVYLDYFADDPSHLVVDPDDFLGRSVEETLPSPLGAEVASVLRDVRDDGKRRTFEYTLFINDEKRHYLASVVRIDTNRTLTDVRDVTSERRAQLEMEALLTAIPDILIRMDREGRILHIRVPEGTAGPWARPGIEGQSAAEVVGEDACRKMLPTIEGALRSRKLQAVHCTFSVEGIPHEYEVRIVPAGDDEVLAVVRQIRPEPTHS